MSSSGMPVWSWKTFLLIVFIGFLSATGVSQERRPLSVADLEELLRAGVSQRRVAELIDERGVNWEITAEIRERLKKAGADGTVLQVVERAGVEYAKRKVEEEKKRLEEQKRVMEEERRKMEQEKKKIEEARQTQEQQKREETRREAEEERKRPGAVVTGYPSRPIQLVVPFLPGGSTDIIARSLSSPLERLVKQPLVVVNKPGAAGTVGLAFTATSKPDGYTLVVAPISVFTIPVVDRLFGRTPAFTKEQLAPVAQITADPLILVVEVATPWRSLRELVEDARRRPGQISYATAGAYSMPHLLMEMFLHSAGLKMTQVPFAGAAPALASMLGGHVPIFASIPSVMAPQLKSGKIRALATWAKTRSPNFPDIPTMKEVGYDVEQYSWTALFAPKDTPAGLIRFLEGVVSKIVEQADFKSAMGRLQLPIDYVGSDEFQRIIDQDEKRLNNVIQKIGRIGG